jgi:hypothetical protein
MHMQALKGVDNSWQTPKCAALPHGWLHDSQVPVMQQDE